MASVPKIPPLQNGDRLTRIEFEQRYHAMPYVVKAELIEGVVCMPSPVRYEAHASPQVDLITCFGMFRANTPGVGAGGNGTLRMDLDNEPQPDAFLMILPLAGGQVIIDADDYVVGAPDVIGEVAASSASYDLHSKLHVYRRNGVREYTVWRVLDEAMDWFVLRGGRFDRISMPADGIYRSEALPGFWLNAKALIEQRPADAIKTVVAGTETPEHAAFVRRLQEEMTRRASSK